MKRILLVSTSLLLFAPCFANAQTTQAAPPAGNNSGSPGGGSHGGPPGGPENEDRFKEHKAEILKHLNEHLADVQKRIACVEGATSQQALHACVPPPGGHGGMEGVPPGGGPGNNQGGGGTGGPQ